MFSGSLEAPPSKTNERLGNALASSNNDRQEGGISDTQIKTHK